MNRLKIKIRGFLYRRACRAAIKAYFRFMRNGTGKELADYERKSEARATAYRKLVEACHAL